MKILVYCQHVLGIGHLCRILAILRALEEHQVTLVLGGPPVDLEYPDQVRVVQLPALRMDEEFQNLQPVEVGKTLSQVKEERARSLQILFRELRPDVLLIELFPFGRYGFRFELDPLLELAAGSSRPVPVVCSVRDILVERDNVDKFERRVLHRLNSGFSLLLIHGDPRVLTLDETFSRMEQIRIPIAYTGYVCELPAPGSRARLREQLQLEPGDRLIVSSAGSGSVGYRLLEATVRAASALEEKGIRMQVFTGPYLEQQQFERLIRLAPDCCRIDRFAENFPDWLAAADLSVSMGGYNTTMNVVAAGCPALIHPFAQNREQRLRAERLRPWAPVQIVEAADLVPARLARLMGTMLETEHTTGRVDLDGAAKTAALLLDLAEARK